MKKLSIAILSTLILTGCSVSANDIETASYKIVAEVPDQKIEIRQYDPLVLVETAMSGDDRNGAFGRLFKYISGANAKQSDIPMIAPVIMDDVSQQSQDSQNQEIPMTTPVFMDDKTDTKMMMSFVLPSKYTLDTAPIPTNDAVSLRELTDYNVAAIRFNGTLSDGNVQKHKDILVKWLDENNYNITGDFRKAGYNAPFTLPWLRRNEVLIPIDLK